MHKDNIYSNELQKQYALMFSQRVKRGIRYKRNNGGWCSKAPRGYLNIHDNRDHFRPKIVKDPEYFDRVKRAFKLMLTEKYSIAEIGKIVKMDASFLRRAFRNPFYAGFSVDVDDHTINHEGNWEPMITVIDFINVQSLLESKKKLNGKTS